MTRFWTDCRRPPRAARRSPGRWRPARAGRVLSASLTVAATTCIPDNPAPASDDDTDTAVAASHPDTVAAALHPDMTNIAATAPDTTPPAPPPVLDLETAQFIAAMPLSCLDRPQAVPPNRSGYLVDVTYTRRPGYERDRAFYGCWDWHSAVNSTWAMVRLMKELPDFALAPVMREKLEVHLTESAMQGELVYLSDNPNFERPYGWVWLLLLHAELEAWGDTEASEWAGHIAPLADLLSDRLAGYITDLENPVRSGTHRSTAFAISMGLQATAMVRRPSLERALRSAAMRFFADDRECAVGDEPGGSDFLSPCLEEAALMAMVMDRSAYARWLDSLLPPIDSEEFAPLRRSALSDSARRVTMSFGGEGLPPEMAEALSTLMRASQSALDSMRRTMADSAARNDTTTITARAARRSPAALSHLIGLAFTRAEAMLRIAESLPAGDPRVTPLRELAARHGRAGFETFSDAGYYGFHWIGSFALKYLVESEKVPWHH